MRQITTDSRLLLWFALAMILVLSGCATAPQERSPSGQPLYKDSDSPAIAQALYRQHEEWAGTPYRLGGTSRSGIDCSAFVKTTFASRLERTLPRTTQAQARIGVPISRHELTSGDLVFFRTGKKVQHVGIYVEKGRFLHASTSNGVMLSNLGNPYWQNTYWMARRP